MGVHGSGTGRESNTRCGRKDSKGQASYSAKAVSFEYDRYKGDADARRTQNLQPSTRQGKYRKYHVLLRRWQLRLTMKLNKCSVPDTW